MTELETISIKEPNFKQRFGKYLQDKKKKKSPTYVEIVDEFLRRQGY